jgi:RHS repeat-associated protein
MLPSHLNYLYDRINYLSMGNSIAKNVWKDETWERSTYYLLDAQGNQVSIYEHNPDAPTVEFNLVENNIYGSSRVGSLHREIDLLTTTYSNNYTTILGYKNYEFTNHPPEDGRGLGNVLTVFTDKKIPQDEDNNGKVDRYEIGIFSTADYSPFGVELDGRSMRSEGYRYGYQGSEKDDEVKGEGNSYTTEFRMLDPRVGKWLSLDPLMNKYPWQSPYCSMDGNPICLNDRSGLSTKDDDWHPEDDGNGGQKLVADPGDNMETLKTYLNNIGVAYTDSDLKQWENEFVSSSGNGAAEITSSSGQFENLMGKYLMKMMNKDLNWGVMNCGRDRSCSPTTANRMKLAALAVYGSESSEFDALNLTLRIKVGKNNSRTCYVEENSNDYTPRGRVGYNGLQNSFCEGIVGSTNGNANFEDPRYRAKELGFTEDMRKMASIGGLAYAGVLKEYVVGKALWTDLKEGALIGFFDHSAIFVKYEVRNRQMGFIYWDQNGNDNWTSGRKGEMFVIQRAGNLK